MRSKKEEKVRKSGTKEAKKHQPEKQEKMVQSKQREGRKGCFQKREEAIVSDSRETSSQIGTVNTGDFTEGNS